jgi:hypothetical protein
MAFKLRSGNNPSFKNVGSTHRIQPASASGKTPLKNLSPAKQEGETTYTSNDPVDLWNKETAIEGGRFDKNAKDQPIYNADQIIKEDLNSETYKQRLANELSMFGTEEQGGTGTKAGVTDDQIRKGIQVNATPGARGRINMRDVASNTVESLLAERLDRADNTKFNQPTDLTKEGKEIGFALHDTTMGTKDSIEVPNAGRGNFVSNTSNIDFNNAYNWDNPEGGDYQDDQKLKELGLHEGNHAVTAGDKGMLKGTKNFLETAKGLDGKGYGKMGAGQEVYARYKVSQDWLKDKGGFNYLEDDSFDKKDMAHVRKLLEGVTDENYQQKGIPYDVWTFFGQEGSKDNPLISDEDVMKIFNNVASNAPEPGQVTDDFGNQQTLA